MTKTLPEAKEELEVAVNRLHEARRNFMTAYLESVRVQPKQAEQYPITYCKAEDGLPKERVENEHWN
jgi:hypothetical protein